MKWSAYCNELSVQVEQYIVQGLQKGVGPSREASSEVETAMICKLLYETHPNALQIRSRIG